MPVPALPVDRSRHALADSVFQNRVSLVLGATGCGKSSRVPQFLLEDIGGPVLCTQPRRLAVVAIAKRVAEERGVQLGGDEVGYRIGQRPFYNSRTQLVFATAGVLLEDLKGQGAAALTRYKVIVVDEVHERSVESDLALACIREFMREHRRVKLVLMSATCDQAAFADFFRPVSEGRLARVQITDMALNLTNLLKSTTVRYMEDAVKLLSGEEHGSGLPLPLPLSSSAKSAVNGTAGKPSRPIGKAPPGRSLTPPRTLDWLASADAASSAPSDDDDGGGALPAALRPGTGVGATSVAEYKRLLERAKSAPGQVEGVLSDVDQRLLRDLIRCLHSQDANLGNAILVFLPTYKTLELQHELLLATGLPLVVFALHSSIAIDECIAAMEAAAVSKRKVILATNIAESSLTIHGVRYVVDSCRTLQLCWDRDMRRTQSSIVWASRSQCDQRKGRTGRTCDGVVYRLLPRRVFLETLPDFEAPHITLLHLRRETLGLLCAASPLMSNPLALLRRCLTPPQGEVPADALAYLSTAGAAAAAPGACGYQPTLLGRLLGALPVSIEGAQLVASAGKAGLLRAGVVLAALANTSPLPIHQPFASAEQYRQNLHRYGGPSVSPLDTQAVLLANLAAFLFWDHAWRDWRRLRSLRQLAADSKAGRSSDTTGNGKASCENGGSAGSGSGSSSGGTSVDEEAGGRGTSASGLAAEEAEEQEWCLRHSLIRSSLHSVAELADTLMQVLHQHRPDFLLDPSNNGAPPHFATPAPGSRTSSRYAPGGGLVGAARHACVLAAAPRQWGTDAYGAPSQRCVAECGRLAHFFDGQAISQLEQLVLSKDVDPASLAAAGTGSISGFGQRREDELEYASYRLRSAARPRSATLCRFFLTSRGCAKGLLCPFSHDTVASLSPGMLEALRRPVAFPGWDAGAGSGGRGSGYSAADVEAAGMFAFSPADTVLLLGEGDLAFTEALLANGSAAPAIVSTVHLSREELLAAYPRCKQRLTRLEAAAAAAVGGSTPRLRLLFGVCATQLHGLGIAKQRSGGSGGGGFQLGGATHIVFNFPHTGQEEDDEAHRTLMSRFFASVGAALLAQRGSAEVLLSLCNDQFSRWHVEAAARAAFFFLHHSAPFTPDPFPGYQPKRGHSDDSFPLSKAITYRFAFHPPPLPVPAQ